jgi:hypothetical protein
MQAFAGRPVRAFVVWEPVLPTDWFSPSSMTLNRLSDTRTAQFWDKGRLISHAMGEHDRDSVIWDYIAIYAPGAVWQDAPPPALFHDGPVVRVVEAARAALVQALQSSKTKM